MAGWAPMREFAYSVWVFSVLCLVKISNAEESSFLTDLDFSNARENSIDQDDVTYLTAEDFIRGQQLTEDELNPPDRKKLYLQSYTHGDIVGRATWKITKDTKDRPGIRRNGVKLQYNKWANGVIPYTLSRSFSGNSRRAQRERAVITRAMDNYSSRTCVKWVPRSKQRDYVYIGKIDGCYSDVGRAGGRQEISLDDGCVTYDTAIHEMMHAVGFWHEHERWDRDNFINVNWDNVELDSIDQFGKVSLAESSYYNEKYDYYSIMHYDKNSFSKNGRNTMEVKPNSINAISAPQATQLTQIIGRVKDFSPSDLRKINAMYGCAGTRQSFVVTAAPYVQPVVNTPYSPHIYSAPTYAPPYGQPQPYNPYVTQRPYAQPYTQQPYATQRPFANNNLNNGCQDKSSLCNVYAARCRSPNMATIMQKFCARTCGYCTG